MLKRICKVEQLKSLKGNLIFVAAILGCLSVALTLNNQMSWFIFLICTVRIVFTRQLLIINSCLFLSLVYSISYQFLKPVVPKKLSEEGVFHVVINPDDYRVTEDMFQFTGVDSQRDEKVRGSYFFKSASELPGLEQTFDSLLITGTGKSKELSAPRNIGVFNYQKYSHYQGIYKQIEFTHIRSIKKNTINNPLIFLKKIRAFLRHHIDQCFPVEMAAYLKSLFLGIKDETFKDKQRELNRLGIAHFFSISGFHVYFFIEILVFFLKRFRIVQEHHLFYYLAFLAVFAIITGFSTSVGRSVFYIGLVLLNEHFNWQLTRLDCWSICLVINLLFAPYLLLTAAGQLSFGLTCCIIFLIPILGQISANSIVQTVCFSFLLSLFSIPIVAYHFHEWQILSLLLSVVLAPIFSYKLMPGLLICLVLSFFTTELFFFLKVEVILKISQSILFKLNDWSFLHVTTGRIPFLFYLSPLLLIVCWFIFQNKNWLYKYGLLLAIVLIPTGVKYINPFGYICFVDVNQGASMLIHQPFNQGTILVDTGGRERLFNQQTSKKQASYAESGLIPVLKSLGVSKLKEVFITLAHRDHYGDLLELAESIPINQVIFPTGSLNESDFKKVIVTIIDKGIIVQQVLANQKWNYPEFSLESLYPMKSGSGGNNDSLVLRAKVKNKTLLLVGDLELAGEQELVSSDINLKSNILSVGHHGSQSSTGQFFLEKVRPQDAVISVGANNRYGHPALEVLKRLINESVNIFRTDKQGMIYYQWHSFKNELSEAKILIQENEKDFED